jgi:hypothetical protein
VTGIGADVRRAIHDLEDDLEHARANFERAIGRKSMIADEEGVIANALDELAWEIGQALKALKRQLTREAAL